jgi:hypothetical protein
LGPSLETFSPPQNVSMTFAILSLITRLIKCSQRFNHFVEADRTFAPWHSPESWSRFDRTSIRRPRRKGRALFVQCEIGIGDDMGWVFKRLRGVRRPSRSKVS